MSCRMFVTRSWDREADIRQELRLIPMNVVVCAGIIQLFFLFTEKKTTSAHVSKAIWSLALPAVLWGHKVASHPEKTEYACLSSKEETELRSHALWKCGEQWKGRKLEVSVQAYLNWQAWFWKLKCRKFLKVYLQSSGSRPWASHTWWRAARSVSVRLPSSRVTWPIAKRAVCRNYEIEGSTFASSRVLVAARSNWQIVFSVWVI